MCSTQSKGTMMRKFFWLIAAAFAAVAITSSIALAAVNVKSLPTATFSGASVMLTGGNFSGLGNVEAFANLTVTGTATYTCLNPQGHASPGQNPVAAQASSSGPVQRPQRSRHDLEHHCIRDRAHHSDSTGGWMWRIGEHAVDGPAQHADRDGGSPRDHAERIRDLLPQLHAGRRSDRHCLLSKT
jgi:hypothetical protein